MANENTYDRIEDYLAGNLQGEALEAFGRAMENDPALAEEVALFQEIALVLQPSKEDALRVNLESLGQKYAPNEPAKKSMGHWWLVVVVVLIAGIGWWLWRPLAETPPAAPPIQPAVKENTPPVAEEPVPDAQQDGLDAPTQPESPQKGAPDKQEQQKPLQFAANFQPNPQLEALVDDNFRGNDYQFRISEPTANASLKLEKGSVNFRLSGIVETADQQVDKPFRVLLFSNKPDDYDNFNFLFSRNLVFEKKGSSFQFHVEERLNLPPGLYYYLIEVENGGTLFHAGKLSVE